MKLGNYKINQIYKHHSVPIKLSRKCLILLNVFIFLHVPSLVLLDQNIIGATSKPERLLISTFRQLSLCIFHDPTNLIE